MKTSARFDSLIRYTCAEGWPAIDWRLIKAQAIAESSLITRIVSPAGAVGLLQLMPAAFAEALPAAFHGLPREDPEANLAAGVSYLRRQFERFPEVEAPIERLWFALAAYNCGRGYVNAALSTYREKVTRRAYAAGGYRWEAVKPHLATAQVAGKRPDHLQTWRYVERVRAGFEELTRRRWTWRTKLAPVPPVR